MSLPKTGTRKIVVDGETFRWLIRRKATYSQWACQWDESFGCLHVAVEHAEQPHSTLVIWTDKPHPKFWGNFQKQSVFPSEVAAWIHQAIEAGWQPLQNGTTFILTSQEKIFKELVND